MTVILDALSGRQRHAWLALLEVSRSLPTDWCVVGGQMVHLFCQERGFVANRPTDDGDVALDVRARPTILRDFTEALTALGFAPDGTSPEGHQHRWTNGEASIDILVPAGIGQRAASRTGAAGGTTLRSPGAQQALDRSETVTVQIDDTVGTVRRPNLLGALVSKAAAYSIPADRHKERHLVDFAVLAALIERSDHMREQLTERDCHYLRPALGALATNRRAWVSVDGAERGIELLGMLVGPTSGRIGPPRSAQQSVEPSFPYSTDPTIDL